MTENYSPYELKLANEIAATLDDRDSLQLHLQYVRKYKEEYLRKILAKVMAMPDSKIKRSRAALYTYLVNQGERNGSAWH